MKEEDRNLEDFFRNRLDSNQFEFQESDWALLEKQMDAAGIGTQVSSSISHTLKFIIAAIVITFIGFLAGWIFRDQSEKPNIIDELIPQNVKVEESAHIAGDQEEADQILLCEEEVKCLDEVLLPNGELNNSPGHSNKKSNAKISFDNQNNPNIYNDGGSQATIVSSTILLSAVNGNPISNVGFESSDDEVKNVKKSGNSGAKREVLNRSFLDLNSQLMPDHGVMLPDKMSLLLAEEMSSNYLDTILAGNVAAQSIYPQKDGRFSVGLALSPDFNGVGFGNKMSASVRPGIMVYYRLFPRLSVSTGAHFDQKRYQSTTENYNAPSGYWSNKSSGYFPSLINGSCRVVDIPLNLNLRLAKFSKVNLGVSAGVSSYLLLDEAYQFEYDQYNPGAADGWATDENSSYLAGLMNLSLYISTAVGRNTYFLVEPYFKAPIGEIGWANLALYGSGVQFTFTYNFKNKVNN